MEFARFDGHFAGTPYKHTGVLKKLSKVWQIYESTPAKTKKMALRGKYEAVHLGF